MRRFLAVVLIVLGVACWSAEAKAQQQFPEAPVLLPADGAVRISKKVSGLKNIRQKGVIVQQLDYSCGAAALATVLTYHFGDPISETDVVGFIFVHGQTVQEGVKKYLRRQGFSLLDLKRFAEFRGYKATGYKGMDLKDLLEFLYEDRLPVLVAINPLGYNHFVVLKGFDEGRVVFADPAFGNMTMPLGRFEEVWVDGIGLILDRKSAVQISRAATPSDKDLDSVTAAGSATIPQGHAPVAPGAGLLEIGLQIPAPGNVGRAVSTLVQPTYVAPKLQTTVGTPDGHGVVTQFQAQHLNGAVQLGDPPGFFIDFTPGPGQSIHTQ